MAFSPAEPSFQQARQQIRDAFLLSPIQASALHAQFDLPSAVAHTAANNFYLEAASSQIPELLETLHQQGKRVYVIHDINELKDSEAFRAFLASPDAVLAVAWSELGEQGTASMLGRKAHALETRPPSWLADAAHCSSRGITALRRRDGPPRAPNAPIQCSRLSWASLRQLSYETDLQEDPQAIADLLETVWLDGTQLRRYSTPLGEQLETGQLQGQAVRVTLKNAPNEKKLALVLATQNAIYVRPHAPATLQVDVREPEPAPQLPAPAVVAPDAQPLRKCLPIFFTSFISKGLL